MSIKEKIEELYDTNSKSGISKDGFNYFYTCPNPKVYPHQWFWDSCFHIIVNSKLDRIKQAKRELETLLHLLGKEIFRTHDLLGKEIFSRGPSGKKKISGSQNESFITTRFPCSCIEIFIRCAK